MRRRQTWITKFSLDFYGFSNVYINPWTPFSSNLVPSAKWFLLQTVPFDKCFACLSRLNCRLSNNLISQQEPHELKMVHANNSRRNAMRRAINMRRHRDRHCFHRAAHKQGPTVRSQLFKSRVGVKVAQEVGGHRHEDVTVWGGSGLSVRRALDAPDGALRYPVGANQRAFVWVCGIEVKTNGEFCLSCGGVRELVGLTAAPCGEFRRRGCQRAGDVCVLREDEICEKSECRLLKSGQLCAIGLSWHEQMAKSKNLRQR